MKDEIYSILPSFQNEKLSLRLEYKDPSFINLPNHYISLDGDTLFSVGFQALLR